VSTEVDGCTGAALSTEVGGFTAAASIDEASIVVRGCGMEQPPDIMRSNVDIIPILHVQPVTMVESILVESIAVVSIAAASTGAAASIADLSIGADAE
jgi:hypothetical protein